MTEKRVLADKIAADGFRAKGIIFDMDGTLVDSLSFWDKLWSMAGERYLGDINFRPTEESDRKVRTMTLVSAMEYIHGEYDLGESADELFEFTNLALKDFYSNDVLPKADVMEFLEYCFSSGIKMCVATATDASLVGILMKKFRFDRYFPRVLSCADIGKGKEHPDIYLAALEYLGTEIADTWVFEDSAAAIVTASKIGMRTVGIYDQNNYGQDVIKENATIYLSEGETVGRLIVR